MCTLCRIETEDSELTQLDLYVVGSEGINVCEDCRMALTSFARSIKSATAKAYKQGFKTARKSKIRGSKNEIRN